MDAGKVTPEGRLQREIQIAASAAGHRLFRMNVGLAWIGEPTLKSPTLITLINPRPFKAGVPGMSDLCGWTSGGRFAAVEVKVRPRKATQQQLAFIAAVQAAGGRACVAYSVREAIDCLDGVTGSSAVLSF